MCKHGTDEDVLVYISAENSHTGRGRFDTKPVDKCIAPIVRALVNHGIYTTGCCCGHGKANGWIDLLDGRQLIVVSRAPEEGGLIPEEYLETLLEHEQRPLSPHFDTSKQSIKP